MIILYRIINYQVLLFDRCILADLFSLSADDVFLSHAGRMFCDSVLMADILYKNAVILKINLHSHTTDYMTSLSTFNLNRRFLIFF